MIYFIKSESGHVKIGYSDSDIEQRMSALQCASPFKLTIMKVIPGDYEQENLIHKKFEKYRVQGEWFTITDDILEFTEKPDIIESPPKLQVNTEEIIINKSSQPLQWNVGKIESELERLNWNKPYLAKKMKMSRQAIHQYFSSKPTIHKAERIAKVLMLNPKDLLV